MPDTQTTSASLLAGFPFVAPVEVRFRDLDPLGHVNNAVYLSYFENARIACFAAITGLVSLQELNMILAEVTVTYHAPALFGDRLEVGVRVTRMGTKSFDMEYLLVRQPDGRRVASGRSVQVMYDYASAQTIPISDELRGQIDRFHAGQRAGQ